MKPTSVSAIVASTAPEAEAEQQTLTAEGTEEIRVEIEQTRAELSGTIDAIQERLSPQNLVDEAKGAVREATIGKAEQMVSNVGETLSSTAGDVVGAVGGTAQGASAGIMETIKANPLPAALAGIGLGWLFLNRQSGSARPAGYPPPRYAATYPSGSSAGVGQTVGQAKARVGELADQAAETAGRQVVSSAGDAATTVGHAATGAGSSLLDIVRENPIPAAVTGLGAAWLWKSSKGSSSRYTPPLAYGTRTPTSAYGVGYTAGDKVGNALGGTASKIGGVVSGTGEKVGRVGSRAGHQAERARGQLDRMLQEQPLAVGAVALGVGAAVGLVAPSTAPESRLMGDARDRLVERVQDKAQDTSQKVKRVASEATSAAKDAAQEEQLTT